MDFLTEQGMQLLNSNQEFNLAALDNIVNVAFSSPDLSMQQAAANILNEFKNHPDSINRADQIIEKSQSPNTKILEKTIKTSWKTLPIQQREAIRGFLVECIVNKASNEETLNLEKVFVGKLNTTLVEILKLDWPDKWPEFLPELCLASQSSETLCQSNMELLKLFSEEIFDYSKTYLTQAKTDYLKDHLTNQFGQVFELCILVLQNSNNLKLILSTLATLERFVHWIPSGYVFETPLCNLLINKFLINGQTQSLTVRCLAEIASAPVFEAAYHPHLLTLLQGVVDQLKVILPLNINIVEIYRGSPETAKNYIKAVALFLSEFMKKYLFLLEGSATHSTLLIDTHKYLLFVTEVDDNDVFRICLDYWTKLCSELKTAGSYDIAISPRTQLYNTHVLTRLRVLMIPKMVKPEEVLVVETESGEVVRETMPPHTELLNQYKTMKETLINLTLLDYLDTKKILNEKLQSQYEEFDTNRKDLNCICWAIGSISGAMSSEEEKSFLVTVIRFLLWLVEMKKGKDNKAAIAANIMYIVGQYPRFLKAHWNFLKTVVNKLFEFMHETHEGVQDMACDTFIKIAHNCKVNFVLSRDSTGSPIPQYNINNVSGISSSNSSSNGSGGNNNNNNLNEIAGTCFVDEILENAAYTIRDLNSNQTNVFFEAVAIMISAEDNDRKRDILIEKCMYYPNMNFDAAIQLIKKDTAILESRDTLMTLTTTLRTNTKVATALGNPYNIQLRKIYVDLLNLYKCTSAMINNAISTLGEFAAKNHAIVKSMRGVKKETLSLLQVWIGSATNVDQVVQEYLNPLLEAVLTDYRTNIPQAREAEVLALMCVIVERLGAVIPSQVQMIFAAVFECTLDMINKDLAMYPFHRTYFFQLLQVINKFSFDTFFTIPEAQFDLVIEAIIWAMKHEIGSITAIGLETLIGMLENMSVSNVAQQFYMGYYIKILDQVMGIITDSTHNSEFKLQAIALSLLIKLVATNCVNVPLFANIPNPANIAYNNNSDFIKAHLSLLMQTQFANMQSVQIENIITKLFLFYHDETAFEQTITDFLIQNKTVSDENDINLELKSTQALSNQLLARSQI